MLDIILRYHIDFSNVHILSYPTIQFLSLAASVVPSFLFLSLSGSDSSSGSLLLFTCMRAFPFSVCAGFLFGWDGGRDRLSGIQCSQGTDGSTHTHTHAHATRIRHGGHGRMNQYSVH
ncbi:hypothetical protein B0H17DRAFT_1066185, partial [Mycena rosella]